MFHYIYQILGYNSYINNKTESENYDITNKNVRSCPYTQAKSVIRFSQSQKSSLQWLKIQLKPATFTYDSIHHQNIVNIINLIENIKIEGYETFMFSLHLDGTAVIKVPVKILS